MMINKGALISSLTIRRGTHVGMGLLSANLGQTRYRPNCTRISSLSCCQSASQKLNKFHWLGNNKMMHDKYTLDVELNASPVLGIRMLINNCSTKYWLWGSDSRMFATESSSSSVTKFINSQDDLERFFSEIEGIFMTGGHRKNWNAHSREKLQNLCQHLLQRKCECMNIFSFFKENPGVITANQESLHYNLGYLSDLGFRGNQLLYVLDQRPDIWRLKRETLQERVQQLWNLGLVDRQLKKAILNYPHILAIKRKRFGSIIELLRKLQFTSHHIPEIIAESPQIFEEDEYQTELKFQHVLFMMGITDYKEILKARIFNYSYEHIRMRHMILERLGLYQVPDKHGRTKIRNPSLCRIVDSTDKRFASSCAGITLEELRSFSESLKEELAESTDDDDDDDDDDGMSNDEGQ